MHYKYSFPENNAIKIKKQKVKKYLKYFHQVYKNVCKIPQIYFSCLTNACKIACFPKTKNSKNNPTPQERMNALILPPIIVQYQFYHFYQNI